MPSLRFSHLRRVNVARCTEGWKHPLAGWSFDDWLIAVGGEVGEALNVVKKLNRERDGIIGNSRSSAELVPDLADEIADAVTYLDLLVASTHTALAGDYGTFDDLRFGAALEAEPQDPGNASRIGRRLLRNLGALADSATFAEADPAGLRLLQALDELAYCFKIDLGEAVVRKFNATSEKHGMPHRLEVA